MASANFNGLAIVYGEDIRSSVKGCEFHFKRSVERISRILGQKREEFKNLALNMLTYSTPETYSHVIGVLKIFSKDNADNMKHGIEWWDARKENIFRAFTSFDAPQSNQAEAVHAGWKNRDKMGLSLLECCYFDIRDSVLLAISFSSLEKGGHESGFGPLEVTRTGRKERGEIEHAEQLERDLLDFSVRPSSSNCRKRNSTDIDEGSNLPKRPKRLEKLFQGRLQTAKAFQDTMKVKKIIKVSELKPEFSVLSAISERVMYKVTICNVPTCTCPDLKQNGMLVSCKHIIFVFLFVIKIDDKTVSNAQQIGDEDFKGMLSKLQVEERFMIRSESILKKKDFLQILREY